MNDRILITGATGHQGGAIARHLLGYGRSIRVFTRHPEKAEELKRMGAEVAQGDLTDRSSIEKALDGIKRMFLVTTPYEAGMDAEISQGINGAEVAKTAGVEHLVYSSVGSAQRNTGIPHFETKWKIEQHIKSLGLPATILRPVFFMENFGSGWMLPMLQNGMVSLPLRPNRKLAMIAVDNIGEYGARAFIDPDKFMGAEIELAGDELTMPDAIRMISEISERQIAYRVIQLEEAHKILGHETTIMYKWFDEVGYNPNIRELGRKYGIPLIRFSDFIKTASWTKQIKSPVKAGKQ